MTKNLKNKSLTLCCGVVLSLMFGALQSFAAPQKGGCPAANAYNNSAQWGGAIVGTSTSNGATVYTLASVNNENTVNGVPGFIGLCVYSMDSSNTFTAPTAIDSVGSYSFIGSIKNGPGEFDFIRPGGDSTDLPMDQSVNPVGDATLNVNTATVKYLVHINYPTVCANLYGAGASNTCFVDPTGTTPPPHNFWPLQGFKFYDSNANGIYDAGDTVVTGWPMRGIGDSQMVDPAVPDKNFGPGCDPTNPDTCTYYSTVLTTDSNGEFGFEKLTVGGTYGVCEARALVTGFTWIATTQRPIHSNGGTSFETQIFCPRHVENGSGPLFGTTPLTSDEIYNNNANANACLYAGVAPNQFDIQADGVYVNIVPGRGPVEFGNVCVGGGTGALTLGFYSNKNGQATVTASDLSNLAAANLANANGSAFDPTSAKALASWLLNATATNMAYMLSAQLATMDLNVAHNLVAPSALVYAGSAPAGCTIAGLNGSGFIAIADLTADANASLGLYSVTTSTTNAAVRTCQQFMETALDNANNNRNFVQIDGTKCIQATSFSGTDCSAGDITNTETGVNTGIGFIPNSCPAGYTFSTANGGSCVPNP